MEKFATTKITRTVNGVEHVFPLTLGELFDAYYEQQYRFDLEDVEDAIIGYQDEDVQMEYGVSKEEYMSLKEKIAGELRRNIDKYDMDWSSAREDAIRSVISEYKVNKELEEPKSAASVFEAPVLQA